MHTAPFQPRHPRLSRFLVCATVLALAGGAGVATARDRSSSVTGPNGQTATRLVSRAQGDVSSTTTGPNGQTATRSVDRSAAGTQAELVLPNGRTVVRQTTRQP